MGEVTNRVAKVNRTRMNYFKLTHNMKLILLLWLSLCSISLSEDVKVVLHLLDHTGKKPTDKKFWIDWSESWRAIEKTKTIEGEDAQEIIDQLRVSLKTSHSQNFCGHDPIYGIIARDKEGKVIKTSLCFKCVTWVTPRRAGQKGKRLHIVGKPGANNPLSLVLRKHIELPAALLKEPTKK